MIDGIEIFVIYKAPRDYPGQFVVRRWVGMEADKDILIAANTLDEARSVIPQDKVLMMPMEGDDKVIIETYI